MLYSQPLIDAKIRYEGSFSYGRAMHQLRQFYVRIVDQADTQRFITRWESKRIAFMQRVLDEALRRDGNGRQNFESDAERKEAIIDVLRDYSDLSFRHWPEKQRNIDQSHIRLYPDGKKKKKLQI